MSSQNAAGMTFLKLNRRSRFYLLFIDGAGQYCRRDADGNRCLFVFTSQWAVANFVKDLDSKGCHECTAEEIPLLDFVQFLSRMSHTIQRLAIDQLPKGDFVSIGTSDFLQVMGIESDT